MTSRAIRIATDSVCDLPADLIGRLGIAVIPTYVNLAGESIADDGKALDRARFYRQLPEMPQQPTTAAPSPGDAAAFYKSIFDEGAEQIISIHVPRQLSGVLNAMRLGAEAAGGSVELVDSMQLTMGMGFQALAAAEMAAEGASLADILNAIDRVREHTEVYAAIDTLEYLKRSGRVNALVAGLGSLLKVKPIIRVHGGQILSEGRQRTWSRAEAALRELTRNQAPLDRLAALHVANREGAARFLDSISDIAPAESLIVEATPTIGTHVGPGAIGVATLKQGWRR